MVRFLLYVLCVFIVFKAFKFVWAFLSLGYKKSKAYKLFLQTNKLVTSECHLFYQIIPSLKVILNNEQDNLSNIADIISKLSKLDESYENIDRKIALYEIMTEKIKKLMLIINESSNITFDNNIINILNQYKEIHSQFDDKKYEYNKAAEKLRKSVDVFPSSYFARLQNIKYVDCYSV